MQNLKAATDSLKRNLQQKIQTIDGQEFKSVGSLQLPILVLTVDDAELANTTKVALDEAQQIKRNFISIISTELKAAVDASLLNFGLVQTGTLRSSLSVTITSDSLQIQYSAPYAALMHYGGYIRPYGNLNAAPVYIPGRPWVDIAIANYDFIDAFNRAVAQL